jgi:phage N-6-adenine-methyltransferase
MVPKSNGRRSIQNWGTPRAVFQWAEKHWGPHTLDAAADADNTLCPLYYDQRTNGLTGSWVKPNGKPHTVWLNPPFFQIADWVARVERAVTVEKCAVTMLLPAAFETGWFNTIKAFGQVVVLRPRIKYVFPQVPKDRDGDAIPESEWPKGINGPPIASMLVRFLPSNLTRERGESLDWFPVWLLDLSEAGDPANVVLDPFTEPTDPVVARLAAARGMSPAELTSRVFATLAAVPDVLDILAPRAG